MRWNAKIAVASLTALSEFGLIGPALADGDRPVSDVTTESGTPYQMDAEDMAEWMMSDVHGDWMGGIEHSQGHDQMLATGYMSGAGMSGHQPMIGQMGSSVMNNGA